MSTDSAGSEELNGWEWPASPFDRDAVPARKRRLDGPEDPFTPEELDRYLNQPYELRRINPYQCMWNLNADDLDGIGNFSGRGMRQCEVRIADPTRNRYCVSHAQRMGVDFYTPPELSEAIATETAGNLTRLVPKAVRTLEDVMEDPDAPAGVRSKAADSVLDRTGYAKGVDVRVEGQMAVVDITAIIKDRLDSLKTAQLKPAPEVIEGTVIETAPDVIIDGNDSGDRPDPAAG